MVAAPPSLIVRSVQCMDAISNGTWLWLAGSTSWPFILGRGGLADEQPITTINGPSALGLVRKWTHTLA